MKLRGRHCQCADCGAYFTVLKNFEKHRIGEFGKDRRCATEAEMQNRGLRFVDGWWKGVPSKWLTESHA